MPISVLVGGLEIDPSVYRNRTSPDGMMTVVFTDIEGSTAMLEQLGEERWLKVLREHNDLLRAAVSRHDGAIVKSQGDGFMLVFSGASPALACSVELQHTFAAYSSENPDHPLRVRIGLHTGSVFAEDGDFFGRAVVLAARITSRARGGEVLVSGACHDYTQHLGRWRFGASSELSLKGLSELQRVHVLDWTS